MTGEGHLILFEAHDLVSFCRLSFDAVAEWGSERGGLCDVGLAAVQEIFFPPGLTRRGRDGSAQQRRLKN